AEAGNAYLNGVHHKDRCTIRYGEICSCGRVDFADALKDYQEAGE
ncbi:hypothetical protein LCGC14_2747280, partial [marine sediment metagenome]